MDSILSVYKASAGSGKTYTLTREYIRMLLGEQDAKTGRWKLSREYGRHRHTLAITFTNKATEEMKRRIIHQLAVLGGMEPEWKEISPYQKDLTAEFGCSVAELQDAARKALKSLLLEFNRFNVSTIDSFFQMVLRAFAREAELTGNYEVELDKDRVISQSVGQLLNSLKERRDPAEQRRLVDWLTQMMLSRIEDGNSFNVFNRNLSVFADLVRFIKDITDEQFDRHREAVMRYLEDEDRLIRFRNLAASLAAGTLSDTQDACRALSDYISDHGYWKSLNASKTKWVEKWSGTKRPEKLDSGSSAPKIAADPSGAYNKGKDPGDPTLDMLLENAASKVTSCHAYYKVYKEISRNMYMLGLLVRTLRIADELMVRENLLMLGNTNYILSRIIGKGDAPFVYERVGETLRHFLIDEFQDTSSLQWDNLRILVENGLGEGYDSLIIGDEKQCIYRFRNSDPSLLKDQIRAEFSHRYKEKSGPEYNINWRSASDIVRFNNMLFTDMAAHLGYSDVYANVRQGIPASHEAFGGYVRVVRGDDKDAMLENMLSNIRRQLASGYRPGDIVILVRGAADGERVVEYLTEAAADTEYAPLRVVSDDAVTIGSSPVIRMIVSILRLMSSPESPDGDPRKVSRRILARLYHEYERMLNSGMDRSSAIGHLTERWNEISADNGDDQVSIGLSEINCTNIWSMVEQIIASPLITDEARDTDNVFLATFQDMVLDFNRSGGGDIASFVNWWDTGGRKTKVPIPPDEQAIRMMTIHKSKGLEFRCVHIPFTGWSLFRASSPKWFEIKSLPGLDTEDTPDIFPLVPSADMELTPLADQYTEMRRASELDELNVAYVAMTRAVSELIVGIDSAGKGTLGSEIAAVLGLEEGEVYESGEYTVPGEDNFTPVAALEAREAVTMPCYAPHPRPDLWSHTTIDDDEIISVQRRRGLGYHGMLSRVRRIDDIERAASKCVAEGLLSQEEADSHASNLRKMIAGHGIERWYEGFDRILCEREMMDADGYVHRPDRVVWLKDGTVEVIDYKTGEEDDRRYGRQVRRYVRQLRSLGNKRVRGYLWYLDSDRIVEV